MIRKERCEYICRHQQCRPCYYVHTLIDKYTVEKIELAYLTAQLHELGTQK